MVFEDARDYIEFLLALAALGGVIVGGLKWAMRYMDDKLDDKISAGVKEINSKQNELRNDINIIKNSVEFIKEYFMKGMRLKGNNDKDDNKSS